MPVVGLNLGKGSIRAVEIESKKGQIFLNNFGILENPKINLDSEKKEDINFIASAVHEFFSEIGISSPQVVVGIDESQVFMRIIKMPKMNDKELKSSIKFEAEQYIPLPLDQVNISYQVLDPDYLDRDKMNVQIVAAKKDILNKYVEIIRKAKLIPKAIEPETMALGRILGDKRDYPVGTLVLEMGYASSLIVVSYGGFVRFTRTIPIGGQALTKAVQQSLDLDAEQSEEYKKVYGMDIHQADGKVYQVLKPLVDNLIMEVKRASVFFTNHNPSANIKRIVLTGGTALMPGLLTYIASNLDMEVQLANPFESLELSEKIADQRNQLVEHGPRYSIALGLAMRGL